ncbi:MAG: polyprenyl synthetase family protein [Deltaproteobacteria bacterium]|nr:polyprenyl synthetase family protein [Deltaproteobacteria bacterium]
MALREIQQALLAMPQLQQLPPMRAFVDNIETGGSIPCWDYAPWACRAAGGDPRTALPAAIAIFASLAAIHLVDDMLDDEADGLFRSIGPGRAANMALSFQSAASRALAEADLAPALERDLQHRLSVMSMATALAQHLDVEPCTSEDDYWRIVDLKTPPLFSCALAMGAALGGLETKTADAVGAVGGPLGRMIQISDDLRDALASPASADWARPRNNLALLYACTAPHDGRARFEQLCPRVHGSDDALAEAHAMLFPSGAASYCVYRMIEAYRDGVQQLTALALPDPDALMGLLASVIHPVIGLLQRAGVDEPARLLASEVGAPIPTPRSTTP